ncbi:metallophosphoesterase family protein [Paenibacillus sp. HN-1]|uniref:metallophosphoesterase family protein n=1 Tax=Paenibacillus TaxID=44249 RepID=UPI001CA93E80|nr:MULTISPECIES: metallophosphoesterase family protein [Paenibacillus]MBY9079673.1 metallophosphoesterase family protein [Paenibacillus sp. CGMCC 1.18879]MBY9082924.1 metallophosphoesterase family protein [Paenibacillus sinensis]
MNGILAVISDIHSNEPALRAVLQDAEACGAELVVNLGDSLFGPVDPVGTYRLLAGLGKAVHIMGNCDEVLLEDHSESLTYRHVKPLLDAEMEGWIMRHQPLWRQDGLLFCHGTPGDNKRYLLEEVTKARVMYKSGLTLQNELSPLGEQGIFCGHSHVYRKIDLPDGRWVVNAGSVGLPAYEEELPFPHVMESGTTCASYVIVRRNPGAGWETEHRLIAYDWQSAARMAEKNGRPDYAVAIATGRVR